MKILVLLLFMISAAVVGLEKPCFHLSSKYTCEDTRTIVDTTPRQLVGPWVSERCEVRPGPQYLLRIYTFFEDGTYTLIHHYYWDSSCSSPKYTLTSIGTLRLDPDYYYSRDPVKSRVLHRKFLGIEPYGSDAVEDLRIMAVKNCPDFYLNHRQNPLCYKEEEHDDVPKLQMDQGPHKYYLRLSCFTEFHRILDEIKYLKIQFKPTYGEDGYRFELLSSEKISNGFQPPLLKWMSRPRVLVRCKILKIKNDCSICAEIVKNVTVPARLPKRRELPAIIEGNWISTRCEIEPMTGLYMKRDFRFVANHEFNFWRSEYKFFLDDVCYIRKFSLKTYGTYDLLGKNHVVHDATDVNLEIFRISLTISDQKMADELSARKACKVEFWHVDVGYNLNIRDNCSGVTSMVPLFQREIVRLDGTDDYSRLMYLSQHKNTSSTSGLVRGRPTSYSEPLMECCRDCIRNDHAAIILYSTSDRSASRNDLNLLLSVFLAYFFY